MSKFKHGDIVVLKSGSPKMTVEKIIISSITKQPNGIIKCAWFVGNEAHYAEFNSESLELA